MSWLDDFLANTVFSNGQMQATPANPMTGLNGFAYGDQGGWLNSPTLATMFSNIGSRPQQQPPPPIPNAPTAPMAWAQQPGGIFGQATPSQRVLLPNVVRMPGLMGY